jgi:hypothetical protein
VSEQPPDTPAPPPGQPLLRQVLAGVTYSINLALLAIVKTVEVDQRVTLTIAADPMGPMTLVDAPERYADQVLMPRRLELEFARSGESAELLQAPPWWMDVLRLTGQLMHRDSAEPDPDAEEVERQYRSLPDASNLPPWLYTMLVDPAALWMEGGNVGPPTAAQAREVDRAAAREGMTAMPVALGRGGVITVPTAALLTAANQIPGGGVDVLE